MSDDIVKRLRFVLNHDRSVELMSREAADEIERLRVERDGYIEGNTQTLRALAEANEIAQRYKRERDEARREVRMLRASSTNANAVIKTLIRAYAQSRGWEI